MIEQKRYYPKERSQQDPNVVKLVRPEGTYIVMYGAHNIAQDPSQLPGTMDGIFIETGDYDYVERPLEIVQLLKGGAPGVTQFTKIFKTLEEKQVPIYFADVALKPINRLNLVEAAFKATSAFNVGLSLLSASGLMREHQFSRRDLFKAAAGIWGISGANAIYKALPGLASTSEAIHPEIVALKREQKRLFDLFVKTIREVSIPHKLGWFMNMLGDNPTLGIEMGSGHRDTQERVGLEGRIIQPSEERLDYLKSITGELKFSLLPESFYQIVKCVFNGNKWQVSNIYQIPELKALIL